MRKILILSLMLFFTMATGYGQSIIGGAGICHVDQDPDNIVDMQTQDVRYECLVAVDTSTNTTYYYHVDSASGSRWVEESAVTTETDPVYSGDPASGITATDTANWNTAFGWGDHSTQGYITNYQTLSSAAGGGGAEVTLSDGGGTVTWAGGESITISESGGTITVDNDNHSQGTYKNHDDAGTNGVAIGEYFTASDDNTMGLPAGVPVERQF